MFRYFHQDENFTARRFNGYPQDNFKKFGFFHACACLVKVRITKPAQASKKNKKKQTTRCTKPAQASKKTKKTKPEHLVRAGVYRSQKSWFFKFFWCLCRFCEDHVLVFMFF